MAGYVQDMKRHYAFEQIEVAATKPMQRLLNEAAALDDQIAELEAQKASKLAAFVRIKENRQVEEMKDLFSTAQYGSRDHKREARKILSSLRRLDVNRSRTIKSFGRPLDRELWSSEL